MSISGFARASFAAAVVLVAMDQVQAQDIPPVNSGANPYRIIRDWAQLTIEKRPWGGSNGGDGERQERRRPQRVRLQLVAIAPVYVCVVDARGRQVIDEETLAAGTVTRTLRSKRFLTNFGNDQIRMRVNGRTYRVASSADPIGYELLPGRKPRRLSDERRPDCST